MKKGIGKTAMSLLLAAAMTVSMPSAGGTLRAAASQAAAGEVLDNETADSKPADGKKGENADSVPGHESADRNPGAEEGTGTVPGTEGADGEVTEGSPADGESTGGTSGSESTEGSPADGESTGGTSGSESTDGSPADGESTGGTSGSESTDGSPADGTDGISGNEGTDDAPGDENGTDKVSGNKDSDGNPADGESARGDSGEEETSDNSPAEEIAPDDPEDGESRDQALSEGISGDSALNGTMPMEKAAARDTDGKGVTYETVGENKYNIYANGQPLLIVAGADAGYAKLYVDSNRNGIGEDGEEITSIQGDKVADETGALSPTSTGYDLRYSAIYGGAKEGVQQYDTYVTLSGISHETDSNNPVYTVWAIYGGNAGGTLTGSTNVVVSGGNGGYIYGGNGNGVLNGDTHVTMSGGNARNLYGGNGNGVLNGDTHVAISGGNVQYVLGGGYSEEVNGNTSIRVTGGRVVKNIFGGLVTGAISGSTSIYIENAQVSSVFGGNEVSGTVGGNTELVFGYGAMVNGWTYGGGAGRADSIPTEVTGSTNITINDGQFLHNVYGGGAWFGAKVGSSNITINGGNLEAAEVYGGGEEKSEVTGKAYIAIQGGTIGGVCASGAGFSGMESTVGEADIRLLGGTVEYFSALPCEEASILGDLSVVVSGDSFAATDLDFGFSVTKALQTVSITLKDGKAANLEINSKVTERLQITLDNASVGNLRLATGVLTEDTEAVLSYINCGSPESKWGICNGGGYAGSASFTVEENPVLQGSRLNKNKFTCITFRNSYMNYFDDSLTEGENSPDTCMKELVVDGGALRLIGDWRTNMPPTQLLNCPLLIRTSLYQESIRFGQNPTGQARIQWMNAEGCGIPDFEGISMPVLVAETPKDGPEELFLPAVDDYSVVYEVSMGSDTSGQVWQRRGWQTDLTEKLCKCQVETSALKETIFPLQESGSGTTVMLEDICKESTNASDSCPIFAHRGKTAEFTYTLLNAGTTAPGAVLEGDSLKVGGPGTVHVNVEQNLRGKTCTYDDFVYFIRVPEKDCYIFAEGMAEDILLSFKGLEFDTTDSYIYDISVEHDYVGADMYTKTLENDVLVFGFSKEYYNGLPAGEYSFDVAAYFRTESGRNKRYTHELTIKIVPPTEVENPDIRLSESRFHYDGTAKEPAVVVKDGDTVIPPEEYTVTYRDNVNIGTATVTIANKPGGLYIVSGGSRTFDIVNEYRPEKGRDYITSLNENGWMQDDFVVSAGEGHLLSLGNTVSDDWVEELRRTEETKEGSLTFYVKDKETGHISLAATETYRLDRTAPETFDIRFNGTSVRRLPAEVAFGQFSREGIDVSLTAADALSGMGTIAYYQSGSILPQAQLPDVKDWVPGNRFTIPPGDGRKIIVYVKATDMAGNSVYYASLGVEFDLTQPAVTGVKPGATYYTTQAVEVTDRNLASVTLNGETVSGSLTLSGNREAVYVIKATDLAGNETTSTLYMKPIKLLAQAIEGLTEGNATSGDRAALEAVRAVEADSASATPEEKEELQEILDTCDRLLTRIDTAQGELADVEDAVEGISKDTVQLTDRETLEKALEELESLLEEYGGNYTEAEKEAIEAERDRIAGALESIEKVVETVDVIKKLPEPESVSPDDLDTERAAAWAKSKLESLTNHEKSLVDAKKLEEVLAALRDYRILEGDGSQWSQETERGIAFRANGAVEKFKGLLVDGEPVDAEHYTVESGSTIVTLKESYLDTLPVGPHTLTFLYLDGETSGRFEIQAKGGPDEPDRPAETTPPDRPGGSSGPTTSESQGDSGDALRSPQTGDNAPRFSAIARAAGALLAIMALWHFLRLKKRGER